MATVRLTAVMEIRGVNPYVLVSKEQAATLRPNWRKPLPVLIRVNGQPKEPWHINLMPAGDGTFYLYLHGNVRRASGTSVGDTVTIELDFDESYRNGPLHPMPEWLTAALAENTVARQNWQKLSPSRQKEILRYFAALKSEDAVTRNADRALRVLSGEPERFMGRLWQNGA